MRNHEQIALGSAQDYWNYHLDQQNAMTDERKYICAGLAVAAEAVHLNTQLEILKRRVKRPEYLIGELQELSNEIRPMDHLEGLGEVIWQVWDKLDPALSFDVKDELLRIALRLKELGTEIEIEQREMSNPNDDRYTDDVED